MTMYFCSALCPQYHFGKEINSISSLITASRAGTLLMILVEIQADI